MALPDDFRRTRDAKRLLREVDAAIKIRDIERLQRYRDNVEPKWWEGGIILLLFMSGFGFIVTIYKLIPVASQQLFWFIFAWFLIFVLSLVATIEFLLVKIHALRKLNEENTRILERIEKHLQREAGDSTLHTEQSQETSDSEAPHE